MLAFGLVGLAELLSEPTFAPSSLASQLVQRLEEQ